MNIQLSNSVVGPLPQDFLTRKDVSLAKTDVWISKIALKLIVGVGVVRAAACLVGIWAFPMDLVVYSGSARAFTIPVTLLGLPVALAVMKISCMILRNLKKPTIHLRLVTTDLHAITG